MNSIGELIMSAQRSGFSHPNFHISEAHSGMNIGQPKIMKGLPKDKINQFALQKIQ